MQLTKEQISEWMNSAFPGHTRRDFEVAKAAIAFAAHNAGMQALDPRDVLADTGHPEADRLIGRLTSADPDFDDCTDAAVLIRQLVAEHRGPDGYATWKDAAVAERQKRVEVERSAGAQEPEWCERCGYPCRCAHPQPMSDAVRHRLQRLIAAWTASANEEQVKRDVDAIGVAAGIRGCVRDVQLLLAEIERLDRAKGE